MGRVVAENILKKTQRTHDLKKQILSRREKDKKLRKQKQERPLTHPEKFIKHYRESQSSYVHYKRSTNRTPPPSLGVKVVFVVRIKRQSFHNQSMGKVPTEVEKVLKLMRLQKLHTGTFVKLTRATEGMLRQIEPLVTYGYLTRRTISELFYKRGHIKVNGSIVPLKDNEKVEDALEKYGIICLEDLIHEIYSCGQHFLEANRVIVPFKLNPPARGFKAKSKAFRAGGDWGNREEHMNTLVQMML